MNKEQGLTSDEIYKLFSKSDLPDEFKSIIKCRFDSMCQAMYNAVYNKETMKMTDTHGDFWQEEHNRFVMEYQKFIN
jgi:hypothetical protein